MKAKLKGICIDDDGQLLINKFVCGEIVVGRFGLWELRLSGMKLLLTADTIKTIAELMDIVNEA
jgi:hypothetical protein